MGGSSAPTISITLTIKADCRTIEHTKRYGHETAAVNRAVTEASTVVGCQGIIAVADRWDSSSGPQAAYSASCP